MLKHADTAMYQAKTGNAAPIAVYAPAMSSRLRDWLELEARLRRAVQEDRVHLLFQPKFRLQDQRLSGVEALLRWCDREHGEVSPTRFIEIAEDSGLILEMGSWVVRAACRQAAQVAGCGLLAFPVAINVSGKELLHGDPARVVETEAAAAGVPTALIEIEITESVLVQDSAKVRHALERLRQLGCRIALDDFGTGYSSLAYITRFPPDRLKIDKAFVRNVDRSASDAAIANAILSLAKTLGLVVTAEGIERPSQLEWLRARGCDEAQGFLLSRPARGGGAGGAIPAGVWRPGGGAGRVVRTLRPACDARWRTTLKYAWSGCSSPRGGCSRRCTREWRSRWSPSWWRSPASSSPSSAISSR